MQALLQKGIDSADRADLFAEEEVRAYIAAMGAKLQQPTISDPAP